MTNIDVAAMKRYSTVIIALSAVLAGCSVDRLETSADAPARHSSEIVATLASEDAETRMTFSEEMDEDEHPYLCGSWSESDAISITPKASDKTAAVEFVLVDGQETGRGRFVSEEELTAESKNWTVYFPSSVKCDKDFKDFSFDGQVQNGDDNTDHLSAYNLMRKKYTFDSAQQIPKDLEFFGDGFEQSSCIKFVLSDLPEAIVPATLTFRAQSIVSYYYGSYSNPKVQMETDFEQTMSFTGIDRTTSLTAYMMLPPETMKLYPGSYFTLTITSEDGKTFVTERSLTSTMTFETGRYNTMKIKKNWVPDTGIDGTWGTFQTPTASDMTAQDCNVIIMGDGYTADDYQGETGEFRKDAEAAYRALFSIEPFKSLKDYFGVYYVNVVSGQTIHTTGTYSNGAKNTDTNTPIEVKFQPNSTTVSGNQMRALCYAHKVDDLTTEQLSRSAILVIANKECYAGTCSIHFYSEVSDYCDCYSIAYVPLGSHDATQSEKFRRLVIHELGGHGFGKLGDEYTLSVQYKDIQAAWDNLADMHSYGLYKNVHKYESGVTTLSGTPWGSLADISTYSPENIGFYEGAFAVSSKFCRSTPNSIMRTTGSTASDPNYFNAISRKMIYHRAMRLAGKSYEEAENGFLAWDAAHLPDSGPYATTRTLVSDDEGLLPLAPPELVGHERLNVDSNDSVRRH